jgi:hypothetical protein
MEERNEAREVVEDVEPRPRLDDREEGDNGAADDQHLR